MKFDISKVFTAANADNLKIGDKVILADTIESLKLLVDREADIELLDYIDGEYAKDRFYSNNGDSFPLAYLVERASENEE